MAAPGAMTRRRSLEARGDFWDNRFTVIKHLALAVVLSLSLAGCQKSPDLGRVQEESMELVKVHVKVLDQLQRRADALLLRGRNIGAKAAGNAQGIADAGRILTEARGRLDQLRAVTVKAPSSIAAAVKTGSDEEVYKTADEMVEQLDTGAALIRADLDAVEQWLSIAEGRPAPAAAPPPAATPTSAPTGMGAPAAAGSAAPTPTP
jgi:hypothetical protein